MKTPARLLLVAALAAVAMYSGARIVAHTRADAALAAGDADDALVRLSTHPGALAARAERQAAAGDLDAAVATAQALAAAAPLDGRAWRIQAQARAAAGDTDQARELYARAIALSPRDLPARAWLADDLLAHGQYAQALVHIDRLLDTAPHSRGPLLAVLVQLSANPDFADVLVPLLARPPGWRGAYLRQLQRTADPQVATHIMASLGAIDGLSPAEDAAWVEELMRRGQWGQAYAHWAGTLPAGARLTPVFNGGFEHPPTGTGFDWRLPALPGQTVTVESGVAGADGAVARIEFRGRPAAKAGLEQALLLAPGSHQLQVRLRSDNRLEWIVACAGSNKVLGTSARISGTSGWHIVTAPLQVPADCPGQWLRLRNPAPTQRSQLTEGRIWIDQVQVGPSNPPAADDAAIAEVAGGEP